MYHVSLGLLEAGMYGVPLAFVFDVFLGGLPVLLAAALCLAAWAGVSVWVMRRAEARFRRDAEKPGFEGLPARLQATVLRYVAVAGGLLLAFTVVPVALSLAGLPVGFWIETGAFGLACFVILLATATAYSLLGLAPGIRAAVYPEYPGFVAALLLDLALIVFFVVNVAGI